MRLQTEIAIIGAGPAGLSAAISAAEKGCKVIVFEKGVTTGGTANMGMGPFAVESRLQKLKQISLTREEAFRLFMDYTHWRVDARLVKTYIDLSGDTIRWLEEMGVEFADVAAYFPGAHFTWHIVRPETGEPGPGCAGTMMRIMTQRAKKLGVEILLQCPVKKILKAQGKIIGLVAEDRNGEEIQVRAKAVVVATGGFGDNPEWIKKYTGFEWGVDLFSFRVPGLQGEGIMMAWEVGAGKSDMNMELIYGVPGMDEFPTIRGVFRQPSDIMVNLQGERFINEEILPNTTFTGNAIARQKGRCAFVIVDDGLLECFQKRGLDVISRVFPIEDVQRFHEEMEAALSKGSKDLFISDSVQGLAEAMGVDANGFEKTIKEYNDFCKKGRDELFHKNSRYLIPLEGPRFYASRNFPGAYGSLGGIKINYRCEVLTDNWEVIPGLYACGTDACSIYGDSYMFLLPGNTMGFALNSGRIAGESASRYVKSE